MHGVSMRRLIDKTCAIGVLTGFAGSSLGQTRVMVYSGCALKLALRAANSFRHPTALSMIYVGTIRVYVPETFSLSIDRSMFVCMLTNR